MDAAKQRLIKERNLLNDRLAKLTTFINTSPKFLHLSEIQRHLLRIQLFQQHSLLQTLNARLRYWTDLGANRSVAAQPPASGKLTHIVDTGSELLSGQPHCNITPIATPAALAAMTGTDSPRQPRSETRSATSPSCSTAASAAASVVAKEVTQDALSYEEEVIEHA